ncbi:MAG: acetate--CoA ligase [Candidatus Omnitrophica bacterium]|nr:acetate--CoA ligase [Candidatus Omnitrophota bacterium]
MSHVMENQRENLQEMHSLAAPDVDKLFHPKSVAVIGASRQEGTVGHAILKNIVSGRYTGRVYPVNPKAEEIEGIRCYPSVSAVPAEVDLAVVIVKAGLVPGILQECAQKGIRGIVVISAGFKETGKEGAALEEEVRRLIRQHRLTLVGPNCLGLLNTDPAVRLNATFAKEMPAQGNIAFVSQSGALCTAVLEYARTAGIGFSKLVSMGNKAGLSEVDLLLALRDDPSTKVILLYAEDVSDGRRFIETAREITGEGPDRKPILAIKSGRTPQGAKAASSHTGSLSGSDELYDAVFAQAGVLRVDTVDELFDVAKAFAYQPLPKGNRVAIITNAGGPGIMATDACVRYGLELASLQARTVEAIRFHVPPTASLNNPLDLIGDAQHDRYEAALRIVLDDPGVDGVIVLATPQAMTNLERIAGVVAQASRNTTKPVLACLMGVLDISGGVRVLEEGKIPHYRFPETAVRALAQMSRYARWIDRPRTQVKRFPVDGKTAGETIRRAVREGRSALNQAESLTVLKAYRFPLPPFREVRSGEQVRQAAGDIGFPLVMKILSPDILHKVDVGGVRLGIQSPQEAQKAFDEMMARVKQHLPRARLEGVVLQKMAPPGTEMILGMKRDPQFGPVLMFGLGGIYVEVFKDVTFRLAPVRELGARRMVESIRARKILEGFRGQPPADTEALIECIERLSQLSLELEEMAELDINPLIVYPKGTGVLAVDARILLTADLDGMAP